MNYNIYLPWPGAPLPNDASGVFVPLSHPGGEQGTNSLLPLWTAVQQGNLVEQVCESLLMT